MKDKYILRSDDIFTKPKIAVFDGRLLEGKIEKTLVRGQVVYDDRNFPCREGYGEFQAPVNRSYS
jgi:dihydroorotase-like cyclic amidohydrolase